MPRILTPAGPPPERPVFTECQKGADKAMCDKAYEAYGDCRAGEFAHWGRLQCESGLRLHDDCRGKYRQHDESACVVVTYNTLQCTDEGMALLEFDGLGKNFLACLMNQEVRFLDVSAQENWISSASSRL
ncbi:hypothetical protein [Microbispora sp. NBRC 16548]|uniref:hypothetical protein n=1 Tax=Microbispora sp. NBRC 16548 TaxID=3030994 RepID=UPI002554D172|nr:hypothetical protein [Microbispora sp. NBRC 16548]